LQLLQDLPNRALVQARSDSERAVPKLDGGIPGLHRSFGQRVDDGAGGESITLLLLADARRIEPGTDLFVDPPRVCLVTACGAYTDSGGPCGTAALFFVLYGGLPVPHEGTVTAVRAVPGVHRREAWPRAVLEPAGNVDERPTCCNCRPDDRLTGLGSGRVTAGVV